MVSRNNTKLLDRQLSIKQAQRFGLRKTTVGLASVLLGTTFFMGGQSVAHADAESVSASGSNSAPTETTNQAAGFQSEASVQSNGQSGVQVQNTQTVGHQVPVTQQVTGTQTQTQSNVSVNTQVGAPENVQESTQVPVQNQSKQTSQTVTQPLNANQFKGNFDVLDAINNHKTETKAQLNADVFTDAKVETTSSLDISKLTTNAIGLTESKVVSTTGTDNQQYSSDMTSRFYGSGQSANHNANQTDPTADYMGHTDRYFSDAQVETNADNIPVNNKGFQFGNNVWQVQLPKEITSLSDWISKLNSDSDYTIGVIDEAGQRHYLTADSLQPFTNSQIHYGYTFDAVNMDSAGKWVKVGTWVVTYTHAIDGYPYLILGCEMTEWPKSLSAVPALPVFVTSPNQKRIFNVRVSQYNGAITGTDVSDNGSSIYAPIGPGVVETGRDMSAHNYGAIYTMNSGQLSQGLTVTIDGGGNYNFAAYHSLSFSNGEDPVVDLNSAWVGEMNAYDGNGNVIGKYKWQFNDEGGAPVGEQYIVGHGSWIKYVPNDPNSGVTPMPLVARYLSNNNGEKGKVAFTFMPDAYATRPTSLDIKKVIIHYVDAETGESLNQDEVYEIAAQRSNTDNSWTNTTPTVHKISGDKTSTFSNLSVTSNGTFKFSVKTNDPNQTIFNAQFTIPTISKLNVNYPVDIYKDWNPYTLTVQVVQPKIDYQIKYVDEVTGQTVGTQNVSDKGVGNHTINYSLPAGYQLVPASDYPKTVKSDNGQLLFDDQTSHAHVTNATVIPVKVVKNDATGLTSNLVKLHQGLTFNKDTFASLVPTISVNGQNATDKGELTYSYDGIQKYALDMDAQGRVEQIQINNPGLVATATFQGNLGNLVDQNGNPSTAINKIVREYYALEPGGRLAIYKASENMYGAYHSPFYLNGFLYGGAKAIKIVTHYYDNSGNELKINLASDILPVALTGMHTYAGTVSGVKLEDAVESNVASNQSVLVKNLADGSSLVHSVAGDHSSYRPMGIAGTSQGTGYIIGAFDPTTGEASTGTSKNLGYVMLSQPYDIQMSDSLQMKTIEAKRTIHFVDGSGNKVHDDVEQNVSWLEVYQDGKLLNTTTDKSFNSVAVPTIAGQTPSVTVVPTESVAADSPINESYTVTYVPSSIVTVNVVKPGETITITPDSQDKHGYKDSDFTRTITRTVNITSPTGTKSTLPVESVTFTRNGHLNILTNKMTFDPWSENGSHTFADVTSKVPAVAGYTPNSDLNLKAVTVTPDSHDIVVNVTYSPIARSFTINYMNGATKVGAYVYNGHTGDKVDNVSSLVNSNLPKGYVLKQGLDFDSYTLTPADNQAFNVSVVPAITHLKPGDHGIGADQFSRTITRTITINQPSGHAGSQIQSVTFNRNIDWDEANNQAIYGMWSENGQHVFQAVDVPALAGYKPDHSVDAVTVTPDSQSSTVVVNYIPQPQGFNIIYVDADNHNARVKSDRMAGVTGELINLDIVAPTGYQLSPSQSIPKTVTLRGDTNPDITVYLTQKLDNVDPNNPATIPAGYTKDDFAHTVTRDVTFVHPDMTKSNQHQSFTFTRNGQYNEVTKKVIFGQWSNNGSFTFDPVSVVNIPGYKLDHVPGAVTVTPKSTNITDTVNYVAQPQSFKIIYVDVDNNNAQVKSDTVSGKTGQNVPVNITVPTGYVLADGQTFPHTWTFNGTSNPDITVKLSQKQDSVNPNDPSTWPTGVTEHDLKRTITRTVTINKPDHTSSTQTQSVTFTRGATYNEITKQVAYQSWSENGSHTFSVVQVPEVPGYRPDKSVDALTVNPDSTNATVVVNYIAQPQSINVNYVDVNANNKLVEAVPIKGVTDQTVSVNVAVPDGYVLVDGQSIPKSITFKASGNVDITVQLKEKIDTIDINDPKMWPAGLTEHDLKRTITRDVTINNPDSTHSSQHQSVTFTRGATYNEVTKQVTYDPWSDGGKHTFDAVPIPPIRGYAPSQEVPASTVTPDSSDITETVTYRALGQSLVVHYLDLTNKPVGDQVLKGVTDQMIDVDLHLPTGWALAPGQNVPKQIKFNGIHNVDMNVYVVHQITPVDPNNPSTIPNGYPLDQNSWKRDISRTVNITEPNGHQSSQTQSTEFTRSVSFDQVLKQYIFGPWSKDGMDTLAEIAIPSHPGYVPSATAPKEIVTPDSKSEVVDVIYIANGQTTSYSFVDDDNNGSKVGEDHFISGRTDETVPLSISIPGGYQLAANQTLPKIYHFASADNQPLVIHLQHVLDDATNDPKADTTRTITRTIEITNPDNKVTTDSQSVKFTRTAKKDAVTGNYIYGDWSNDGHQRFEAYTQPSLKGYNKTGSAPQVDVTPDTKDIKVELGYSKQPLRRLDPNDPSTWTKGLTYDDFERDISRTITLHAPNMENSRVTKQAVTFTRDIYQDPVTDQLIYKDWQVAAGNPKFDAVLVPQVKGYQASVEDIPAVTATPDMKSSAVDVAYTQLADKQIDPNNPHTWPSNISEHDLKRTITRTIEFDNPDGTKPIKVQSMIFARRAHQNQVTDQIIFNPWSENGSYQFGAVNVPSIKGYQPSLVRVSALNVTPDSQNSTVKINYTKLPDLVVDPNDPVTWIDGLTEHDLKRTIKRTIVFNVPKGPAQIKVQTVTFVRGAKIDEVTDKITFDPWSENGSHQFDAVTAPNFKGYDANPGSIASWTVTPDSQDSTVNVAYNKQANRVIDPNDPKTWPDGITEHDLKRTVTRTITIHTPNAKPQVIQQSVTFVRGASQDPVTDQITFDPWSENGQHRFGVVNVPKVKGYDASRSSVSGVVVTPDSKSVETVDVTYTKQANRRIDPNDPSTWPKGLNPDDLKRTISREIVFALPNGSSQKVLQTITFTRDGSQDPVSDKITWGSWSDNGKHHFDEVPVIKVKGYTPNINKIDALDVTPDTKLPSGGRVSVVYLKQPDRQIYPNNPSTWPSGVTENDVKRTITRTITFQLPDGTSKQIIQTVTFTRGGSVDAVTGKITWQPWSEGGKHHFASVNVPQFKGYNSSIDAIDGLDVTPDTKLPNSGSIMIEYTKQANRMIDPNDPSTWPDGVTKDDLFRHLERDITYQLPDGTSHTIHQRVDFTRSGEIDPVTGKITWHPWSHNGKYHFDNVNLPHVRGYVSNPLFVPGLDVTPDTKLSGADAKVVVSYIKQVDRLLTINDPSSWPKGMTVDDFKKVVTRTINFHLPTGLKTQVQTVTLLRTGELDAVTGQVIWNPFDMGQFEAVKVPQVDGYQASLNEVPEMSVDGNSKNLVVDVDYQSVEKHDDNDSDKNKHLTSSASIDPDEKSQGLVLGAKSASVPVNNGTVASSTSTIATVSLMSSNTNSVSNQKSDQQAALPQTGSNRDQAAILGLAGAGLLLGASGLAFKKKYE